MFSRCGSRSLKENVELLVVASKETGQEVNADKTKYMVMSRDQNAGRSHSMKIDNNFFERVEEFKYLGTTYITLYSVPALRYHITDSRHVGGLL